MTTYRRDIDGLRAVAVAAVVMFHADVPHFGGGFTGVDVFFVISGFLITGLLSDEYATTGRVSLPNFYARRVRRLLPALLLMTLATLAMGIALLPATGELQSLGKSTLAALFFGSNVFFFFQPSGYFADAADSYPLLHTWTLAVEEQFYVIWPLLVTAVGWTATKLKRNRIGIQLVAYATIGTVSFALCQAALLWRPKAAFYIMPLRAWEFAVGAALSVVLPALLLRAGPNRTKGRPRGAWRGLPDRVRSTTMWTREGLATTLSLPGLAACAAGFFLIEPLKPFPNTTALLPVLGTAAMLAGNALNPGGHLPRLLSTQPMVYIGRLSYGWYLWHWPLFAFARWHAEGKASTALLAAVVAASFLAAALSYHLIESPVRTRQVRLFESTCGALVGGLAILALGGAGAGLALWRANALLSESPLLQAIVRAKDDTREWPPSCSNYSVPFETLTPEPQCIVGDRKADIGIVLWGDSHAAHLISMFDAWGQLNGQKVLARTRGGCRPFGGTFVTNRIDPSQSARADCARFGKALADELPALSGRGMHTLVLASLWPWPGDDPMNPVSPRPEMWLPELKTVIAEVQAQGFRVVLVVDTPKADRPVATCLARHTAAACAPDRAAHEVRRAAFLALTKSLLGVRMLDLTDALCTARECPSVRGLTVIWRDADHLSIAASAQLAVDARAALDNALLP